MLGQILVGIYMNKFWIYTCFFVTSNAACAAPLVIDPSDPPSLWQIQSEQGRLNVLNIKVDSFTKSEAALNRSAEIAVQDIMPAINNVVSRVDQWQNKLNILKLFIKNIDQLTPDQQENFRQEFVSILVDLYEVKILRAECLKLIGYMRNYVQLADDFEPDFIVADDVINFMSSNSDVFRQYTIYKAELYEAADNFEAVLSERYYEDMEEALRATINIIDNILVVRSLDYPELSSGLEEMRRFTRYNEYLQPRLAEFQRDKGIVSDAVWNSQIFMAQDTLAAMNTKLTDLTGQVAGMDFSDEEKQSIENILRHEITEAARFLPAENMRASIVASRFEDVINQVKPICTNAENILRYRFKCAGMIPLLGINEDVTSLSEDKLRFIEYQIDYVLQQRK